MIKLTIFALFLAISCTVPAFVSADAGLSIPAFHSDIAIQADGMVRVAETIAVDFATEHHGIYRDLPVNYQKSDGTVHYTKITDVAVTDSGSRVPFELIANDANLRIKIGDPDRLISGRHTYEIEYRVAGVLASAGDHDELYWNVTGNDWEVWLNNVSATVRAEGVVLTGADCYAGATGSNEACTSSVAGSQADFSAGRPLPNSEGMTVIARYTAGVIPILTVAAPEKPKPAPFSYVVVGFCTVIALGSIFIAMMWWHNGRDDYYERKSLHDPDQKEARLPLFGAHEPIVPEYDPPAGLRPAEIGVLMDEKADDVDISATVVDLAVRGYLTITEKKKSGLFLKADYLLTKTDKPADGLLVYEKLLYDRLFSAADKVTTSSLKNKLNAVSVKIKEELYSSLVKKKLFVAHPEDMRKRFRSSGWFFISAAVGFFIVFGSDLLGLLPTHEIMRALIYGTVAGLAVVGVMLYGISFFMPKRTAQGRELYRQARGYRLFVSGTEKYRQPFFERENIFMTVLPYAMVFGVTHQLAKAMEEMHIEPAVASWYVGSGAFHMSSFSNSMDGLSNSLSSSMAAAPQTGVGGGGGFSGGGFGGGGGGGW